VFLNNVSLGLYAGLVLRRERHRRRGEVLAGVRALARLTRRRHRLRARIGDATLRARILLVANNAYELSLYSVGARPRLDEGTLHLYCADGWLPTTWVERASPQFRIELDRAHVVAAADGEPIMLESPLEVESLPQALRVLVP
jgi:diacylglycerol kinase family enzyme